MTLTLTLSPSARNSSILRTFTPRSCSSVRGRMRISFSSIVFWCLRASFSFLACSYLNLPQSISLQTGGTDIGETSTRSRSRSRASAKACAEDITPIGLPSSSIRRTSRARTRSLMRVSRGRLSPRKSLLINKPPLCLVGQSMTNLRFTGPLLHYRVDGQPYPIYPGPRIGISVAHAAQVQQDTTAGSRRVVLGGSAPDESRQLF